MKYQIIVIDLIGDKSKNIVITYEDDSQEGFPALVGNPNYDKFLVDAKLTDKQVKALKPDVWYDFPEGDK